MKMRQSLRHPSAALLATLLLLPAGLYSQEGLRIDVVSGQGATNSIAPAAAESPVVEVRDGQGRPVAGAKVSFRTPAAGPSATFYGATREIVVNTDEEGRATATYMLPNTYPGPFAIAVQAEAAGASAVTEIPQTNAFTGQTETPRKWKFGPKRFGPKMKALVAAGVAVAIVAVVTGGDN